MNEDTNPNLSYLPVESGISAQAFEICSNT